MWASSASPTGQSFHSSEPFTKWVKLDVDCPYLEIVRKFTTSISCERQGIATPQWTLQWHTRSDSEAFLPGPSPLSQVPPGTPPFLRIHTPYPGMSLRSSTPPAQMKAHRLLTEDSRPARRTPAIRPTTSNRSQSCSPTDTEPYLRRPSDNRPSLETATSGRKYQQQD